jgi:hypothetical protein
MKVIPWSIVGLIVLIQGCTQTTPEDISDRPDVPLLAGRCVEIVQPMLLVRRTTKVVDSEELTRFHLARFGELFAPFTVDEYRSGEYEPSPSAEPLQLVELGARMSIDRVWDLKGFEGSVPVLTASFEHSGAILVVNVVGILDDDWYRALDKGELSQLERQEVAGKGILDARFARFCPVAQ